jgi:hypothetical protein
MSFNYRAFLEGEGLTLYFRGGSSLAFWNARRWSRDPISWDQFLVQVPGIAQLPSFVEREVAVMYDKALRSFRCCLMRMRCCLMRIWEVCSFLQRSSGKIWPHRWHWESWRHMMCWKRHIWRKRRLFFTFSLPCSSVLSNGAYFASLLPCNSVLVQRRLDAKLTNSNTDKGLLR